MSISGMNFQSKFLSVCLTHTTYVNNGVIKQLKKKKNKKLFSVTERKTKTNIMHSDL